MAFDLLWRFDAKKKKQKNKKQKQNKTKKQKKIVCLLDICYSFRFERFIIPLKVE